MNESKVKSRIISFLLALLMVLSVVPQAAITPVFALTDSSETSDETVEDETVEGEETDASADAQSEELWEFDIIEGTDNAVLTKYNGDAPDVYIPGFVEKDGEEYKVTKLGDGLFENNDGLNSATLGAGILEIGAKAFYDCDNLLCVLPSEELTTIGDQAFAGCDAFNSIILYNAVVNFGADVFKDSSKAVLWVYTDSAAQTYAVENNIIYKLMDGSASLEIYYVDGVGYHIQDGSAYAISYDVSHVTVNDAAVVDVPAVVEGCPVTVIYDRAFENNTTITTVNLPNSIKTIKSYAFSNCSNLVSLNIPQNLKIVGNFAFNNCINIKSIQLPDSVISIGENAFRSCKGFSNSDLPKYIQTIGSFAFGETDLTSVVIPSSLTSLGNYVFFSCDSLITVEFSNGLTNVPDYTFNHCDSLQNVILPSSIRTIGRDAFYRCGSLEAITLPEGLVTIDIFAFNGCYNLKSIVIPASVKNINNYAFCSCNSLTSITFAGNSTTVGRFVFESCSSLKEIVFPSGTTIACNGQFKNCVNLETVVFSEGSKFTDSTYYADYPFINTNLKNLSIPGSQGTIKINVFGNIDTVENLTLGEGITSIDSGIFNNAKNLRSVVVPKSVTTFGGVVFPYTTVMIVYENSPAHEFAKNNHLLYYINDGVNDLEFIEVDGITYYITDTEAYALDYAGDGTEIVVPKTVEGRTVVGLYSTFTGNTNIKSVVVPDTVNMLVGPIFDGCTSLTSVSLPKELTTGIPAYMFNNCTKLESVQMPDTISGGISAYAFYNCSKLTDISIPKGIISFGTYAFYNCSKLTDINIPEGVRSIGAYAFYNCDGFTSINIPEGVTKIADYTFYSCTNLANVTIPIGVTEIGNYSFSFCTKLASIDIPDSVTVIKNCAFGSCTSITSISIPSSVTSIWNSSFNRCTSLETVVFEGATDISDYAFSKCEKLNKVVFPEDFGGKYICGRAFNECISLKEITIPYRASVQGYMFEKCELDKVIISEGISGLVWHAFVNAKVKEFVIPSTVKTVKSDFSNVALERVTLSEGVLTISSGVFVNCTNIQTVIIPRSVSTMYADSFASNTVLLVYENSYAHQFAMDNNLLFFVYDGVNIPKIVTVDDVVYCVMPDYAVAIAYKGAATEVVIPEAVDGVTVTELRATFRNNTTITSITLPETLTNIGDYTFQGCTALATVNVPENVINIGKYAFHNCYLLSSKVVLKGVVTIGFGAFHSCYTISNLELGENLKNIGQNAFFGCSGIKTLTIPSSVESIGESSFENCAGITELTIGTGIKSIPYNAFRGCGSLVTVSLSDGLNSIGSFAFAYCSSLKTITIPDTVTAIGTGGFYHNSSLEAVDLSDGISTIEASTFYYCTSLKIVDLPGGLSIIDDRAFSNCTSLETISFPDSLWKIGENAFYHCTSLKSVDLNNVSFMEREVFYGCSSIEKLTIPTNCLSWPNIFSNCTSLKTVVVEEGVTTLCNAFQNCPSLETIDLPSTLDKIYNNEFYGCGALSSVNIKEGTTTIFTAFGTCGSLRTLYIPNSVSYIQPGAFSYNTILLVHKDSYAHKFAQDNDILFFVLHNEGNPDIAYGDSISGTVRLSGGSAVEGATVDLIYDDGTVKESVKTDANGIYTFTYAEVGRYTIRATYNMNGIDLTANTQISIKRMNVFDVFQEGDSNLKLKTGWNISGSVSGYGEGEAVTVTLTDGDGNVIVSVGITDGSFELTNIYNGTYILKAETESSSIVQEVTVFDADLKGISLELPEEAKMATIQGYVEVEDRPDRDGKKHRHRRNWVSITLYNNEGVVAKTIKSNKDGWYSFTNILSGEYTIVAEVSEMRPCKYWKDGKAHYHDYDKSYTLTGYAYVTVTEGIIYTADTIVLREEHEEKANISGKVTAHGSSQKSEVTLRSIHGHEIAKTTTGNNGKYTFANVADGAYLITAVTEFEGMGYTFVIVSDGRVYRDTNIIVHKSDKVKDREDKFKNDVPDCHNRDDARKHKDRIIEEKRFYDGLSEKEKKQLSKDYTDRLHKYCEWIAEVETNTTPPEDDEPVNIENAGSVVSGDELQEDVNITFNLTVEKKQNKGSYEGGIENESDYIHHKIAEMAGKSNKVKEYYEISMTKQVGDGEIEQIESVCKDTGSTGKFRITLTIPEEHRGHKHYNIYHEHHGQIVTLADLDDNPDTITVEVDKFSMFVLTGTDEELVVDVSGVASIGDDKYETLEDAISAANDGDKIVLLSDIVATDAITIDKSITIDGDIYTLTSSAVSVFNIDADGAIVIENLNIVGDEGCQRGIVVNNSAEVTVKNVKISDVSRYAICVESSAGAESVLNIEGCELSSWCAIAVYGNGRDVVVTGSALVGANNYSMSPENEFSVIAVSGSNINVSVDNESSMTAVSSCGAKQYILRSKGETEDSVFEILAALNFEGDNIGFVNVDADNNSIILAEAYAENLKSEGYTVDTTSGKAIVTGYAEAIIGNKYYATFEDAIFAANDGDKITILADVVIKDIIKIEKSITIDGQCEYSVTGTDEKTLEIYADVTLENLTVINTAYSGRAVDTRKAVTLVLDNVAISTNGAGNNQALTIGGAEDGTIVTMTDAVIEAGTSGYGIISFVESTININDSVVTGYAAIYAKKGSANSVITVGEGTVLNGNNTHSGDDDSFAVIVLEDKGIDIIVESGAKLNAVTTGGSSQAIISFNGNETSVAMSEGAVLSTTDEIFNGFVYSENKVVSVNETIANALSDEGYVIEVSNGVYKVIGLAVAEIGENKYATLNAAFEAADGMDGTVNIAILRDTTVDSTIIVGDGCSVILTLNGYEIDATESINPIFRVCGSLVVDGATDEGEIGAVNNEYGYIFIVGANDGSDDGALTIDGGDYFADTSVASVTKGVLNVTDGSFCVIPYEDSYAYTLNCIDANYKNGSAAICIFGGMFYNWNPKNNKAEGANTSFVADGYVSKDNGNGTWSVTERTLFKLYGANMTLDNDLSMNFFFKHSDIDGNGYYVKIVKAYNDGRDDVEIKIPYDQWNTQGELWKVTFSGVAAKEMSDKIYVTVYDSDDEAVSLVWEDSVREYAMRAYSSAGEKLRRVLVDMLNYGASAQNTFKYNTGDLANKHLSEEQRDMATSKVELENSQIKGEKFYGTILTLESNIKMTLYFVGITSDMNAEIIYEDCRGREKVVNVSGNEFTKRGDLVGVVVDELVVADGYSDVTCVITDAQGNTVASVTDSMESYALRSITNAENAGKEADPIFENVMKFVTSAREYLLSK